MLPSSIKTFTLVIKQTFLFACLPRPLLPEKIHTDYITQLTCSHIALFPGLEFSRVSAVTTNQRRRCRATSSLVLGRIVLVGKHCKGAKSGDLLFSLGFTCRVGENFKGS